MKRSEGFTLLELVVAIAIIGALAVIATPTFLSLVAQAKESEARAIVGQLNRAQVEYRHEHAEFASSFDSLNLGIPQTTKNYSYKVDGSKYKSYQFAYPVTGKELRKFSGGVVAYQDAIAQVQCAAESPKVNSVTPKLDQDAPSIEGAASCPPGTTKLN